MTEVFAISGWGVVFAAWSLSAGVGVLVIAVATAMTLRLPATLGAVLRSW